MTPQQAESEVSSEVPVVLTEQQAAVKALAGQGGDIPAAPTVEELRELSARMEMSIPKKFTRPEFMYHYKDMTGVAAELVASGGIWQVVTRTNHSHIPSAWFHPGMGAVVYRDCVLCFARREWREHHQSEIRKSMSMRMDATQNRTTYGEGGREMASLEMLEEGELKKMGRGYGATPDRPGQSLESEDVDFEEV